MYNFSKFQRRVSLNFSKFKQNNLLMEVDWANFLIQGGATKIWAQSNLCLIKLKTFPSFTFNIIQKAFEARLFKVTSGSVYAEVRRSWDNLHIFDGNEDSVKFG